MTRHFVQQITLFYPTHFAPLNFLLIYHLLQKNCVDFAEERSRVKYDHLNLIGTVMYFILCLQKNPLWLHY